MTAHWPGVGTPPTVAARIRVTPADFEVREQLGFTPSGAGEHVFLQLEKCGLNTLDLVRRLTRLSDIESRDIGYSGLKDRNAITSQWFSLRMAGRAEPDWQLLGADGKVRVLDIARHARKLKRGVHRANTFVVVLRELRGDRSALPAALERVREHGVPNYFGGQRFGRRGSTLSQARRWLTAGGPKIARERRSLYLSALRAQLFNTLLAQRVQAKTWNRIVAGDVCMLRGSRSLFTCEHVDATIERRVRAGDVHPGLPLWGNGAALQGAALQAEQLQQLAEESASLEFLERAGLSLSYRPARLLPDDFCWQFCDDGALRLEFSLGTGSYATAVLAEIVAVEEDEVGSSGCSGE